jgi:hypothetical protein
VQRHIPTPPRLVASLLGPNSTVQGAIAAALAQLREAGAPTVLDQFTDEGGDRGE